MALRLTLLQCSREPIHSPRILQCYSVDTTHGVKHSVTIDQALDQLAADKRNMKCSTLESILGALGFKIRRCSGGGHRVYSHPQIKEFHGSSFNGGHRADGQVKPPYVLSVIKVIKLYKI